MYQNISNPLGRLLYLDVPTHTLFHSNPLLQGRASVAFPLQYVRLCMNNGRDRQLNIEMKSEE